MLPASCVWHIAWISSQLLPPESSARQSPEIDTALASSRRDVLDELRGMWCDALLSIIQLEWPKARQVSDLILNNLINFKYLN